MERTPQASFFPYLDAASPRDALRWGATSLSYAELGVRARAHARWMLEAGLAPGDRVLVWATPTVDTVVAIVGHLLGGLVTVPVNPEATDEQIAHVLRDASPRVVVGDVAPERVRPVPVVSVGHSASDAPLPAVAPSDPCVVLYTSGTTGLPKGALHSHGALAANVDAICRTWQWTARDVLVHALPLFHGHGFVLGLLAPLRVGGTVRIFPRFEAEEIAGALGREGTMLFGSPETLQRLGELCERDPAATDAVRRARLLATGSAPFPVRESNRILRLTGHRVVERYGITETLFNASTRPGEDRPGYVGRPLDGVEIRLVDDERRPLDAHDDQTLGEIAIKNPGLSREYLNRPDATAASRDADGWFYSGDLGTIAPDGAIRLRGRRSTDLIVRNGRRVAAFDIEDALLDHPDVREAAVVGQPTGAEGEAIVAFAALHPGARVTAEELRAFAAKGLAAHEEPRVVHLVPALPRNAIGKVVKATLKSMVTKPPSEWDAPTYDRISEPQFQWGVRVLERLALTGDETVIDAGCGSGRLTELLCERLPRGRVIAVDASQNMLDLARSRLVPRFGERVDFLCTDLLELDLEGVADVCFSTATFHWVKDHDMLFRRIARALKPSGRLHAQCGGGPILARFHERAYALMRSARFAPYYADWTDAWHYADDVTSAERLTRAGFVDIRTSLEEAPTRFASADAWMTFLRNVVMRAHLDRLPTPELQADMLGALAAQSAADDPPFTLDYWRLNLEARRNTDPTR